MFCQRLLTKLKKETMCISISILSQDCRMKDMKASENHLTVYIKMNPEQLQLGFLKVLKGSVMHDRAQEYGIVYQDRAPYEVLSTKWLTYAEVIRLKQIERWLKCIITAGSFAVRWRH